MYVYRNWPARSPLGTVEKTSEPKTNKNMSQTDTLMQVKFSCGRLQRGREQASGDT